MGQQLLAGPGDLVLKVNKQRDLKNAFGRADLFGRKTDEGYSELRFAGAEADGTVVFYRKDVVIVTNETTMSRTPLTQSFGSATTTTRGTVTGSTVGGQLSGSGTATSTTSGSVTTISPHSDYHVVVPPETVPIRIPAGTKAFPFEGGTVEILSATPTALSYRVGTGSPQ